MCNNICMLRVKHPVSMLILLIYDICILKTNMLIVLIIVAFILRIHTKVVSIHRSKVTWHAVAADKTWREKADEEMIVYNFGKFLKKVESG
jgi:hypothetical protein